MANFKSVTGGRFAKKVGSEFEVRFQKYCYHEESVDCIRIEDGCVRVGSNRFIPKRQPFDWVVLYKDTVIFCDTKTTLDDVYSLVVDKISFQLKNFELADNHNQASGYLVEFREAGEFRWFSYKRLLEIMTERKSLKRLDGVLIGTTFPMKIDFNKIIENC